VSDSVDEQRWPGERLGLPEDGPGAVAGWGRRLVALLIDWFGSMMVVAAAFGADPFADEGLGLWGTPAIFVLERWVLTSLTGGSAGQLVARVRVGKVDGGGLGPGRVLLRTVLLMLLIPPVVYNRDHRGLHDLAARSIAVRI
jgi:uncharacterized RDD family membrane protein YckC